MIELKDIKTVLPYVAAYQQELAIKLTKCNMEDLEETRFQYNAINKLITRMNNDINTGKSEIINELNKGGM